MPWVDYRPGRYGKSRGIAGISDKKGFEIYHKTIFHDDGVKGYGGMRIACIGPMRAGKTTLGIKTINKFFHIEGMKKEEWLRSKNKDHSKVSQETIVYRGRKLDYWNCLDKQHFKKCFPNAQHRDLRVFVFYKDKVTFYEEDEKDMVMKPISGLDIYYYHDQADLYRNLLDGQINVVYVPNEYKLSPNLKKVLNDIMMLKPEMVNSQGNPVTNPNYFRDEVEVAVINETFWYDLFYYIVGLEKQEDSNGNGQPIMRSIAFFFDEAHQIFPQNTPKPFWYLVEHFAENEMIDTGRLNLTIYCNIHALNLMHWKVLQRFDTFIWLFGSKPDKSYSMVSDRVTRSLHIGEYIIEEKQKNFGKGTFKQIPNQPYTVLAKGIN